MAMAQGCSERNISAVVLTSESTRALRAVHAAFRLSQTVVRVGVVISNELGVALVDLLDKQRKKIQMTYDIDIQVCAVMSLSQSKEAQLVTLNEMSNDVVSINNSMLEKRTVQQNIGSTKSDFDSFSQFLVSEDVAHTIIFDCTAEKNVSKEHPKWLEEGIDVITANNTGLSGSTELRAKIDYAEKCDGKLSAHYLREVTIGGGLPVISTIRNLLISGDHIRKVDGILSVSLSYIMYRIAPPASAVACFVFDDEVNTTMSTSTNLGIPCSFSQAVKEAIELGLMESDPFKDLSNEYTARCLMVLAKELDVDQNLDVSSILSNSVSLVDNISGNSYEEMMTHLERAMIERVANAEKNGCVPRHVSTIDVSTGDVSIKVLDVPNSHPFATTPPSCECVRFFTEHHKRYPLIVQVRLYLVCADISAFLVLILTYILCRVQAKE